jgi:MFS family permease
MLVLKVMYGIIFGVTIPLSQVLMTECTPLDKRGKTIVSLQIMFILGRIWIVCLALIFFVIRP